MKAKTVAIITARGGSKRIPRKNIKKFLGAPILKYSIEAALKAKCFDEVMVSTDDKEIARVAKKYGAKMPFMRSKENSDDHSTTTDVLIEVISDYKKIGRDFDFCACVYPTVPFVTGSKLKKAVQMLKDDPRANSVLPVVRFSFPIQRASRINKDGYVTMIKKENFFKRSQDLEPAYHDCGQFYVMRTKALLEQKKHHPDPTLPLELPESEVQDIDNLEDWKVAEIKYKIFRKRK